jgi:hypothetical protein
MQLLIGMRSGFALIIASSSDTLFDDLDLVNLALLLECLKYVI